MIILVRFVILTALLVHFIALSATAAPPTIDTYGNLPKVRSIAISDSGNQIATLREDEQGEYVLVKNYATGEQTGFKVGEFKSLSVDFFGDRFVLLRATATESFFNYRSRFEYVFGVIFDTETGEAYQLLEKQSNLLPGSDASQIVGILEDTGEVLIPALTHASRNAATNTVKTGGADIGSTVFRVKLDTGRVRVFEGDKTSARLSSGSKAKYQYARDWVISSDGTVLAREDYNQLTNKYRIYSKKSGSWKLIFQNDPEDARYIGGVPFSILGAAPGENGVFVKGYADGSTTEALYEMNFEGELSEPIYDLSDKEIVRTLSDDNRRIFALEFSGVEHEYAFFDEGLGKRFDALRAKMAGFYLKIVDWTRDRKKLIVQVSGGAETGSYYLFDVETGKLSLIEKSYEIAAADVGQLQTIEYRASDGLTLSAIVTWPPGDASENLPAIILPHGGPASHDSLKFDWFAQSFASRGYLVFQPNFRGSSGFGEAFERAGDREWGGRMQSDIQEGVEALISTGWVDPERICIVGVSYGGYAALAGGVSSPELYKCVAAIAPISDLPDFLSEIGLTQGERSYAYEYWETLIGDPHTEEERLKATSPSRHADVFEAPVLLVHGRDDTIVPLPQSRKMHSALQRSGKTVKLIELEGGDHWLSTSEARLAALRAVSAFVDEHLPLGEDDR